eukprot:TRINITY_DN1685_c0_g2_i1.p1 TRINITY_DN1685_c0_g2~~TRINITY_DN1685_c0_g2_i1.p1  ORF type:complete len:300 (-),score=79.15 TRINITY_DN1685_c0_g2_i1:54-827(-)
MSAAQVAKGLKAIMDAAPTTLTIQPTSPSPSPSPAPAPAPASTSPAPTTQDSDSAPGDPMSSSPVPSRKQIPSRRSSGLFQQMKQQLDAQNQQLMQAAASTATTPAPSPSRSPLRSSGHIEVPAMPETVELTPRCEQAARSIAEKLRDYSAVLQSDQLTLPEAVEYARAIRFAKQSQVEAFEHMGVKGDFEVKSTSDPGDSQLVTLRKMLLSLVGILRNHTREMLAMARDPRMLEQHAYIEERLVFLDRVMAAQTKA